MSEPGPRVGVLWWCGDYECGCTCPEVRERVRERTAMMPERWDVIWQGTFRSQATRSERAQQLWELRAACRRLGARKLP